MKNISIKLLALSLIPSLTWGQSFDDLNKNIPIDQEVRIDTLENGLTYYIRNNNKPEQKVDLRLVVKAGSVLETEEQLGLAHFTEHMLFNGTKRFPKNTLVDYLQSIGVKFGQHLNAYTSFDETVYFLPIPIDDKERLNKGFEILEDWAFNAELAPEEIDKERGVVLEEYRRGLGAQKRMMNEYFPKLFYNSRYAERLPIGEKEVIENFTYDKLISFYKDWYRPNLMSVIVVGDIDIDKMEEKIKAHFSDYKNPENEKVRKYYGIPEHEDTLISIVTDPEALGTMVQLYYKESNPSSPIKTLEDYKEDITKSLFLTMLNHRLEKISNQNEQPYTGASASHGKLVRTSYDAFSLMAITTKDKQLEALKVLLQENTRLRKYGFTALELNRAKKELLSKVESNYSERNKAKSSSYVQNYQNHFLFKTPINDAQFELDAHNYFIPKIELEDINSRSKEFVKTQNPVVILIAPEDEESNPPSKAEVRNVLKMNFIDLQPYENTKLTQNIIRLPINKGEVVKSETNKALGSTTFILSNGAKVTVLPTDFKNDEILFKAISFGGSNQLDNKTYKEVQWALEGLFETGVSGMNKNELNALLSDKNVELSFNIEKAYETISGETRPKDLHFFMELVHAYFTDLNYDEDAFNNFQNFQNTMYGNMSAMPYMYFVEKMAAYVESNNPRFNGLFPSKKEIKNTSYERAFEFYQKQFSNASDFHFYFVGNIELNEVKDLSEKYIASLPSTSEKDKIVDLGYRNKNKDTSLIIKKGKDPKSNVFIMMSGEAGYDSNEALILNALGEILTIKLIEELRENESGVYSPGADARMGKIPYTSYDLLITFSCSPENAENLTKLAINALDKIIDEGPSKEDLNKYKSAERNVRKEKIQENEFWLKEMENSYLYQRSPDKVLNYLERVEDITAEDIQKVAKKYLSEDRMVFMHLPEDKE